MLEKADIAGHALRPASLLMALRERTRDLHTQAERTGIVSDILHGRATRQGYALFLRNLLPIYQTLEACLASLAASPLIGPIARPALMRTEAIESDLMCLSDEVAALPVLPATETYMTAIGKAAGGDGGRLIAHAYARYLGDLSGGQIVSRLLARTLALPPAALAFYDFPGIADIPAFKTDYRAAIDRAGDESDDFEAIVEEGALAFELNIALSLAVQAEASKRGYV